MHTNFRNFRWFNQTKNLSAQRNELKYREVICQSLIRQFKYQQIQMYLSFCQFTKYTVSSLEIFLHLSRFEWQTMVDCSVSGLIYYQIVFNYNIKIYLISPLKYLNIQLTRELNRVLRLTAGRWFSPVSSTNKTDLLVLLKVALTTINLNLERNRWPNRG